MQKNENLYTAKRRSLCNRVVVWFSCGATSAVAAKLTIQKYRNRMPIKVFYCDTGGEHYTNLEFLREVESWIEHPITVLKNNKYRDHFDVFYKERYLVGPSGAKCTSVLKKELRHKNSNPITDIQVFGYSVEKSEQKRAKRFREQNPEVYLETPLIERDLNKSSCLAILEAEGITLPFMYHPQKSGIPYDHNNCIGCPKGGAGYWNKIRVDFPEVFQQMVDVEIHLNRQCVKHKGERIFLKDLPPDAGRNKPIPPIQCDLLCGIVLEEMQEKN